MRDAQLKKIMDLSNMDESYLLLGLINHFNNHFQTVANSIFKELSWKQVFFINCISLFDESPTIRDMSDLLGCSHQNAKQILSKLESSGFVSLEQDANDKRKLRIHLTDKATEFNALYSKISEDCMKQIFEDMNRETLVTVVQAINEMDKRLTKLENQI